MDLWIAFSLDAARRSAPHRTFYLNVWQKVPDYTSIFLALFSCGLGRVHLVFGKLDRYGLYSTLAGAGLSSFMADWIAATQGQCLLEKALKRLAETMDATVVAVSRLDGSRRALNARMLVYDGFEQVSPSQLPLKTSFASYVRRYDLGTTGAGSVRLTRISDYAQSPPHLEAMKARGLESVLTLTLLSDDQSLDFLEIGFAYPVTKTQAAAIDSVETDLARSWACRLPNVFAANLKLVEQRVNTLPAPAPVDPLSFENTCHLTRMEHAVARLVSEGHSRARIQEDLKISKSTLTKHLIGIYAKVGVSSYKELTRLLGANKS